jgi:hypothetical protein
MVLQEDDNLSGDDDDFRDVPSRLMTTATAIDFDDSQSDSSSDSEEEYGSATYRLSKLNRRKKKARKQSRKQISSRNGCKNH